MSQTFTVADETTRTPEASEDSRIAGSVAGTVDVFDAAAHLEAMGFGERAALTKGYANTFEHAGNLVETQLAGHAGTSPHETRAGYRGWAIACGLGIARALIVLCGVLICIGAIAPHTTGVVVFAAGAAGWPAGQAVSAGLWQGLSADDRFRAKANALVLGVLSLAVVEIGCLLLGSQLPLYWALWCCAISVPMVLGSMVRVLTAVIPPAAVIGLCMLTGSHLTTTLSRLAILLVAVPVAGWLIHATRRDLKKLATCARRAGQPVVWLSIVQALALIAQLAVLIGVLGERLVLPLALAGLVASAACEPILDTALWWARRAASTTNSWRALRWSTSLLGIGCTLATVVPGVATAVLLPYSDGETAARTQAFLAAVAITCLSTASCGLQLRTGNAVGATLVALASLATVVLSCWIAGPFDGTLVAALVITAFVCVVAARRTSLAANW